MSELWSGGPSIGFTTHRCTKGAAQSFLVNKENSTYMSPLHRDFTQSSVARIQSYQNLPYHLQVLFLVLMLLVSIVLLMSAIYITPARSMIWKISDRIR